MSPVSISISHLAWSTPDGQVVFDDLDLEFGRERTGLIGRNGVGKSTLLRLLTHELEPAAGSIRTEGKIAALRQVVQVPSDETIADILGIASGVALLNKVVTGTATMEEMAEADWTLEGRAAAALAQVGLDAPLETPLVRLSGGQRTRAALAGAVFAEPDFLLLDEPTNNLDRDGRRAVRELLQGWRAGAVVVSHDRDLLEGMDAIVELSSLGVKRYGGNWSHYRERKEIERAAAEQDLAASQRRMTELARKTQVTAERQQRRDAAGSRKAARGDMPRILIGARREQAEKSGGNNARLAQRQRSEADLELERARSRVERFEPMSVQLAPTGLPSSRTVLALDRISAGYEEGRPVLSNFSLTITGPERIAILGGNGSGKSTLLRVVTGDLTPWSGHVMRGSEIALLDQRVSLLDPHLTIAENFRRLNPGVDENSCRAALARFRFRAGAADQRAGALSGGQMLRAGLACVLGGPTPPPLLLLDEPTNHLDLASTEAVESGLQGFDGALLVVSHDTAFLDRIAIARSIDLDHSG